MNTLAQTDKMLSRKEGHVGYVIFNNPERRNAVSLEMLEATARILTDFGKDPDIRCVVLTGAGDKAFVSGADISKFENERSNEEAIARYNQTVERANAAIYDYPKPTIAMIRGYCLGGGLLVALHCDLRLAAETARLGIPAAKLGIAYTLAGVQKVVDLVGPAFAKEILYTARQFNGVEAQSMGLINRAVAEGELEGFTRSYCTTMAENAPLSIAAAKGVIAELMKPRGEIDRAACDALGKSCMESEDFAEGRRAFGEKRKPVFRGR